MVTQFRTLISGAAVTGGGIATFHTEDPVDDDAAQLFSDAIRQFWLDICARCDEDVTFQMDSSANRYAAATGALQQVFSITPGSAVTGVIGGNAVPRASQGLVRWNTAEIVNNRMLKGRTYVPGLAGGGTTDAGGLSTENQGVLEAAGEDLLDELGGTLVVWSRPVGGAGGSTGLVTAVSVWDQFAVLRSRRD